MMNTETFRVELDATEIEPGIFVYAEAEVAVDFNEIVADHGGYPVPTLVETPLVEGSLVDSAIIIADGPEDGGPEEEIDWEVDVALFAQAEARVIAWLVNTSEGRSMVSDAIEDTYVGQAEAAYERSLEARW